MPPVETSSTQCEDKAWANSTNPVLSVTLNNARLIGLMPLQPSWLTLVLLSVFLPINCRPGRPQSGEFQSSAYMELPEKSLCLSTMQ